MLCLPWLIVQNSTAGHLTIFKNVSAVSTKLNSTYWFDIVLTRWVFYNNAQNHVSYSLFVMCLKDASCLMWTVILRTITGFRFIIVWHAICIKSLSRYTSHDRVYLPTGRVYLPTDRDYPLLVEFTSLQVEYTSLLVEFTSLYMSRKTRSRKTWSSFSWNKTLYNQLIGNRLFE